MSSREQYRDYVKRLKAELAENQENLRLIARQNRQLVESNDVLRTVRDQLIEENNNLLQAVKKTKRWWQILIFIKTH